MEFVTFPLAAGAFVFSLAALAYVGQLQKKVKELEEKVKEL